MKKFWVIFILLNCIIVSDVFAYSYPSSFWGVNSKYEDALKSNNYSNIIKYGNQEISIINGAADGNEKRNVIVTRYDEIGNAYAALGDYEKSAEAFNKLYNYAYPYRDEYYDYVKGAKAKANQYASIMTMYTDNGASPYFGAKNEKSNGVLYGTCHNGETRSKLKNESMVLIYQELGLQVIDSNADVLKNAASKGMAIEFALNCPNEAKDIKNINNMSSYLKAISDVFSKYPNTPFYLRFAGEFDIWSNYPDADSFKYAFRYVSQYFKSRNSNVAIVWSPSQASKWYIEVDDYYPGDEYVDWVGVSLYAQKYFLEDNSKKNAIAFKTGINSDPVIAIKEFAEKYGDRKPMMLTESGCSHKVLATGEDTTQFAMRRLKEYMSYLPMVYPQIKLMAYFDWCDKLDKVDNRLSNNKLMQDEYIKLTQGDRFIQGKYNNETGCCYRPVTDNIKVNSIFPVSCYAHKYGDDLAKVMYYIDGNYVGSSSEVPFTAYVDASGYTGRHTLKAIATFDSGETRAEEKNINISGDNRQIAVRISDNQVTFDQNPVIYNERTMVPMRKIFEELGAVVSWDGNTKTAIGKKGDRAVRITVGSKKMYVNSKEITLDTSAMILSDRTLVPARAVAEGLGCDVNWDGNASIVYIVPKVFKWSDWDERLPSDIDDDLYYIEKKKEYRYSIKEYTESSDRYLSGWRLYDSKITSWGGEQGPVYSDPSGNDRKVRYEDYIESSNYKTIYHYFRYADSYHATWGSSSPDYANLYRWDLDYELQNTTSGPHCFALWCDCGVEGGFHTVYSVDWKLGEQYKTQEWVSDNYARKWYYREPIYTYCFSRWSDWTDWDDEDPYDYYGWNDEIDVDERTVYRYKEKG